MSFVYIIKIFVIFFYTININVINGNEFSYYDITPIANKSFGSIIRGIDICSFNYSSYDSYSDIINSIHSDVISNNFVILKNQCNSPQYNYKIPPNIYTLFVSSFASIDSSYIYHPQKQHPAEPTLGITAVSNDYKYGQIGTGWKWHLDGDSFRPNIFAFQHFRSLTTAVNTGGTELISQKHILNNMKIKNLNLYLQLDRIYIRTSSGFIYPFISWNKMTNTSFIAMDTLNYIQIGILFEILNDEDILLNKLFDNLSNGTFWSFKNNKNLINQYISDKKLKKYSLLEIKNITQNLIEFIDNEADDKNNKLYYITSYEPGDLLIRDNRNLIHRGHISAQLNPKQVGLRILWTLTIDGPWIKKSQY